MSRLLTKATDRFSETAIDDEVVVMSLGSGDFFSLTDTARTIWQQIDGTRDRDALVAALATQFGCDEADIAGDVDAFLGQLDQAGLLVPG
ncbi:MAG: HPr-rel-A system PqqD family peptide chaperone [Proteobacteria bacterium]|nr:HPr-rel-A system PqqD family peptide chaperone [Pseudomonadota bacterium]MDE2410807.1 HPr-rel-A system PqqD family peptide chaperone [Sphingomonadales bacterium]